MTLLKSPLAAKELGISYHRLMSLLRYDKVPRPAKDSSGDYVWTEDDLAAARCVLMGQPFATTAAGVLS
jgi:hypothetical protein